MFNSVVDILDALKEKTLKVAKLSKETGIPSSRIYKWKDRGSKITAEDAEILKEWIKKMDNSRNNGNSTPHAQGMHTKEDYLSGKNLDTLYEAHGKVIDTNAKLAEANYLLAVSIARALPETRQDQVWPPKLAEWVREFYSGKKVVPIDELLKELQKASMPDNSYKR